MKKAECQELFVVKKEDAPEIIKVKGVRGYVDEQNVAWLNVEDVARGLGFVQRQIKNGKEYISLRLETVNRYLAEFGFPSSLGKDDFIPENMFYRLAMKANNEAAKEFQAKVADEILPNIRKHGFYATPTKIEEIVRDPDRFIEELYNGYKRVKSERDEALAQVAELKPKADYCEMILQSEEALPVTVIAKDYGMSAASFNELLNKLRIHFKVGKTYVLYQPYAGLGYTRTVTTNLREGFSVTQLRWTQKGRMFLYNMLKKLGILPTMEQESPMATLF